MARNLIIKTKMKKFGDEEIECIYTKMREPVSMEELEKIPPEDRENYDYLPPLNQRTYIPEEGILCEQDVAVKMRDGVTIYVDIYRPITQEKVPVIISWSFYGKRPFEGQSEWKIMGVPPGTVSNMSKFESPDPGFWCRQGYAVANVDPRGIGHSEGDFEQFGTQDGQDGYDFIEWVTAQHWCNGRAALSGNSCVAMTQWRIAAQQPPHLACIAPWEGTSDLIRESLGEGGIPACSFVNLVMQEAVGPNYIDNTALMYKKYPYMNGYWKDKIPDFSKIRIPVYATACWNHFHLRGSMIAFRKIRSTKKWMRCHRDFEWPDAYNPKNLQDLKLFFDRYLKDVRNGWELTPRYRIEVQDAYDFCYQTNRPENEFPLKRTVYQKLYLNAAAKQELKAADQEMGETENASLQETLPENESRISYDSEKGLVNFDYTFNEDTEITGFLKLRLWVEAEGHDDMDMFVNVQKLSTKGEWIPITLFGEPHPGAWGKMRVSRRKQDEKEAKAWLPVMSYTDIEKLSPGEIVPVDIEIWPTSRIWHKGQQLRVQISGRYIRENWFEPLIWDTENKGRHVIHTGGQYDSYLQIPVIPPKFQDGDCIYR